MSAIRILRQDGGATRLDAGVIAAFTADLRGSVLHPDDAGYDTARTIWNALIDNRPDLIVRCEGVADVIAAVDLARDNDLRVSVRGGGHNVSGNAVCDGGFMIDLWPISCCL